MIDDFGRNIHLTPFNDYYSSERWNHVEMNDKFFNIGKNELPNYINVKKGRPPTPDEDYCPNCYEIIAHDIPITNCSGCLSPII